MILISSTLESDPTVLGVTRLLEQRGCEVVVLTPSVLEQPSGLIIAGGDGGPAECILHLPGGVIDLREVRSAWLWRGWCPDPLLEPYHRLAGRPADWRFYNNEWAAFHKGLSLLLGQLGVFCVNPPPWNVAFEEKCCQLALAAEAGLSVPPTLFTARLSPARAFARTHGDVIVYKPFRSHVVELEPSDDERTHIGRLLTNRVRAEDLVESDELVPTPGIFQPYIPKQVELRIVVVGRRLFTCAIHSQSSERSRDDWRRYDVENTPHVCHQLPEPVAASLLRLVDRMGLVFGSADMIVTPAGEHVFLEINPNGQFDFVVRLTGMPVYEHLAAMLAEGSVDYSVEEVAACGSP
jgi:glutathione synthase/RimK-type ligase-like ATP-grasp enzyme